MRCLIYLFLFQIFNVSSDFNLYFTDQLSEHCFYIKSNTNLYGFNQIIRYCLSESVLNWKISTNNLDQMFTFDKLYQMNITSQQLYHWSSPIDICESYQLYFDQRLINKNLSSAMDNTIYFNCSFPRFGCQCEYLFDDSVFRYPLESYVHSYYQSKSSFSENDELTCYVHLNCNHIFLGHCLDWTEICDGKIDCEQEIDEKDCSLFDTIACHSNEYRCSNGQCIPSIFINDDSLFYDCLDRSDEYQTTSPYFYDHSQMPTISNEDISCSWRENVRDNHPFRTPLTSSCQYNRQKIITKMIFSFKSHENMSEICFLAMKCYSKLFNDDYQLCETICEFNQCLTLINDSCPDRFPFPLNPVAFNEIYFVYSKKYILNYSEQIKPILPEYICCGELNLNETNCYRLTSEMISFEFDEFNWLNNFMKLIYSKFSFCNRIKYVNGSSMYQCQNSMKFIRHTSIGDGIRDCYLNDDEQEDLINRICLQDQNGIFFKCQSNQQCFHRNRFSESGNICPIVSFGMCDQKFLRLTTNIKQMQFPMICNGIQEFYSTKSNNHSHTDETDCEQWPCSNETSQFKCTMNHLDQQRDFYCKFGHPNYCVSFAFVCHNKDQCQNPAIQSFCDLFSKENSLEKSNTIVKSQSKSHSLRNEPFDTFSCHRGIPLHVLIDSKNNIRRKTCLCPPIYYGNYCQYQNQRVSLTIKIDPIASRPQRSLFLLFISLIDNTTEKLIHSYDYVIYSYEYINYKYHMYLTYSSRPKDLTKEYSIHIDIYEIINWIYRGSLVFPLKYSFLPVERLSIAFPIPHQYNLSSNSNPIDRCIHGKRVSYVNNHEKILSFCHCQSGWLGKFCNISYECRCSSDSLCMGIDASNRSICMCSLEKFGSKCLLNKDPCERNKCLNHGVCIALNPNDKFYRNYFCFCQNGFSGDRCEIRDYELFISFEQQIHLPLEKPIFFSFINSLQGFLQVRDIKSLILYETSNSLLVYWSYLFNYTIIELETNRLYFLANNNQSSLIHHHINESNRCQTGNQVFNRTILQMSLMQRMKYYHIPCQNHSFQYSCFYDESLICFCYNFHHQRLSDCLQFESHIKLDHFDPQNKSNQFESSTSHSLTSSYSTTFPIENRTTFISYSNDFFFQLFLYFCSLLPLF